MRTDDTNMPICFDCKGSPLLHPAYRAILLGALLMVFGACATISMPPPAGERVLPEVSAESGSPVWWYVRFRLARAAEDDVSSYLDTLIADQILASVIAQYGEGIALWRFHRRWAHDNTGHQFSFIFFAPVPVAEALSEKIARDPLLEKLTSDGHLVEFRIDAADPDQAGDPAATSDRSWPVEIQREWPNFIMGASRMWLGLVQAEAAKHIDLDLYRRYQAVEVALEELWLNEANHAFFHHLSALFGYRPVRVIRRDIMTF